MKKIVYNFNIKILHRFCCSEKEKGRILVLMTRILLISWSYEFRGLHPFLKILKTNTAVRVFKKCIVAKKCRIVKLLIKMSWFFTRPDQVLHYLYLVRWSTVCEDCAVRIMFSELTRVFQRLWCDFFCSFFFFFFNEIFWYSLYLHGSQSKSSGYFLPKYISKYQNSTSLVKPYMFDFFELKVLFFFYYFRLVISFFTNFLMFLLLQVSDRNIKRCRRWQKMLQIGRRSVGRKNSEGRTTSSGE